MIQSIKYHIHRMTHPFIARQLVWELEEGGGVSFGLGCIHCGEIEWIDRYRGMELQRMNTGVHVEDFFDYVFSDEDEYYEEGSEEEEEEEED